MKLLVPPQRPGPWKRESLDARLSAEHRGFEHLLEDIGELVAMGSFRSAGARLLELRHALERHLSHEERVLLPLFTEQRKKGRAVEDPSSLVQGEHEALLSALDNLSEGISRWEPEKVKAAVRELLTELREHHRREETLVHPKLEALVPDAMTWERLCFEADRRRSETPTCPDRTHSSPDA